MPRAFQISFIPIVLKQNYFREGFHRRFSNIMYTLGTILRQINMLLHEVSRVINAISLDDIYTDITRSINADC